MQSIFGSPTPDNPASGDDDVYEQAAQWVALLDDHDELPVAQAARFEAWLEAAPEHRLAYEEISALWNDPDLPEALRATPIARHLLPDGVVSPPCGQSEAERAKPLGEKKSPGIDVIDPLIPALSWKKALGAHSTNGLRHRPGSTRRGNTTRLVFALASLAGVMIIVYPIGWRCLGADFCTAVGEIRNVSLADGSRVTLDTKTALTVSFAVQKREIRLLHGKALFDVNPDRQRPFRVLGHYSQTEVTGTRFIVGEASDAETVTVLSGTVKVGRDPQPPVQLRANEQISVGQGPPTAVRHLPEPADTAWMSGNLLFDDATLAEVIREIGRYRRGVLMIRNERLKSFRVSGLFDITDTDRALTTLEQTLPIHIHRITPWLVVIS